MSPKVSIIIPAYNAEKTIARMLDAVRAQTFENYEVIVIDDGSTDGTRNILEEYAHSDSRIRIFHQENAGVSAARNRGLDEATGDYVLFYDADDTVPENAVHDMYFAAREHLADLVIGRHCIHYMTEIYEPKSSINLSKLADIPKNHPSLCHNFTLCNKMLRREVIEKHGLRFGATKHAEDGLFLFEFIRVADKLSGCPAHVYTYIKRTFWEGHSLSQQVSSASFQDARKNILEIAEILNGEAEEALEEVNHSDVTQAAKDEAFYHWRRIQSRIWKRFAQTTILDEYYRKLWNGDDSLYPLLRESLEECQQNMFPTDWEGILKNNPDLQLDVGLLSPDELAEHPLLSVLITSELPKESVGRMMTSYYEQSYVSFEFIIDDSLVASIPDEYRNRPNVRMLPHSKLPKWKKLALQEARGVDCVIVQEPIYPATRTIQQMVELLTQNNRFFVTAPLCNVKDGEYQKLCTQTTVFVNEFAVMHKVTKYNRLDAIWSNKVFNIKTLLARPRLFEDNSTKDIIRFYRSANHDKFEDNSFVTELTDGDILKRVHHLRVRLLYSYKRRKEQRRLDRIEKENTKTEALSFQLRNWRNRQLRNGYKVLTLKFIFPLYYKWHARKPIQKNKVLFIVNRKPTLPNSMTYVHDLLEQSGKFTIHDKFLLNLSLRYRQKFKVDMDLMKDLATANYVFLDEATVTTCGIHKRPETKIVQLWHGCGAFKKFGFSTADKIFGGDAKEQLRFPMYRNFDLVCVSSPEVVWAYEEAMRLQGEGNVKPVGVSRTDVFFQPEYIDAAHERVETAIPVAKDKKIILYAPTFRGRVAHAYGPDHFDYDMLYEALGQEYIILIKHHPLVKQLPEIPLEYRDSFVYDVSHSMEIEDLICVSDICISDYSSLIFEYSLFEKPIILFAYDLDVYFDWRGFYYDYYEMAPGPVLISTEEIIDYIQNLDTQFDKEKMHAFREKFMRSCDGHSTERILDEVGLKL
jgi:CDP-ribitol ribitolphosphotransferase / teichoic acid ribitol-phosphate polymerase